MNDMLKSVLHHVVPNAAAFVVGAVSFRVFDKLGADEFVAKFTGLFASRQFGNYVEAKLDAYTGYVQEDAQSPLVEPMKTELGSEV